MPEKTIDIALTQPYSTRKILQNIWSFVTDANLTIQDVAKASGVSASTLRCWGERGLLSPARTPRGHRRYSDTDVDRARAIQRLRSMQKLNVAAITAVLGGGGIGTANGHAAGRHNNNLGQRLQALRLKQKLTLREVSRRTGLAPSLLSAVENGGGSPSVAALKKLARCYGTTVSALDAPAHVRTGKVIRAGKYRVLTTLGPGIKIEQLAEGRLAMDCQRFALAPGAGSQGQYSHPGEEFIHVLRGCFEITLEGKERYRLESGDSMYFKSEVNHAWVNPGPGEAVMLWINTPPTF